MRKGQVALLTIIGIVIVAAVVIFTLRDSAKREAGGLEKSLVEKEVVEAVTEMPEEIQEKKSSYESYQLYLASGEQTLAGQATMSVVENIAGETDREKVDEILTWVRRNLNKDNCEELPPKRIRTAEQIISSRCATGCIDMGLAFITIARTKNIPAIYVETVKEDWINEIKRMWITPKEGHIFVDVYLKEEDIVLTVDPTAGTHAFIAEDGAYLRGKEKIRYIVLDKGLDSWDIGLNTDEDFEKEVKERYNII